MLKFYTALFDSIILANESRKYATATHQSGQKEAESCRRIECGHKSCGGQIVSITD
jgi:hypothetical protein